MSNVNAAIPETGAPLISSEIKDNFQTIKTELEVLEPSINPDFAYDSGRLSTITYANGDSKQFTYDSLNNFRLSRVDYAKGSITYRKDFIYSILGILVQIQETEF